jgi:hypothetical protein
MEAVENSLNHGDTVYDKLERLHKIVFRISI